MKKAKIVISAILAVLVVFGTVFWWFWGLGSVQARQDPVLRLVIQRGSVTVQSASGMEEKATSGRELEAGDVVKTGSGSLASITAQGRSDLRLDGDTELEIEEALMSRSDNFLFRFNLMAGKTWSRVMQLLDLNSIYEGRTDNTVATVRGTSFALEEVGPETKLFVGESAVATPLFNGWGENVFTVGEWGNFDSQGRVMLRGHISSSTWPDKDWINDNRKADQRFVQASRKYLINSLNGNESVKMDSWMYDLSRVSESLHLAISGERCGILSREYFGRRLYQIHDLVKRGKSGLAFQFFGELEEDIKGFERDDSCLKKRDLQKPIGTMLVSLSGITPEDEMYKFKIRVEELYISIFPENSAEAFWAHALTLDNRLEELERFGCRPDFRGPMENAMEAVEQGLARQDGDFEQLDMEISEDIRSVLANKTHVQHLRLERFLERLDRCAMEDMRPQIDTENATTTTSTDMENTTSTEDETDNQPSEPSNINEANNESETPQPEPEPAPEPSVDTTEVTEPEPTVDEQQGLDLERIQLFVQPNPLQVGGVADLYVKGFRSDGSEFNATSYALFEQIGDLGSIIGSQYQANDAGSVTIIARVNDAGREASSQVSLKINQPMELDYLEVNGNGSVQIYQGETRQLSVIAHYTNGEMRTVTNESLYAVSDPAKGGMSGSVFNAGYNSLGWVTVTATYNEQGVSRQGEVNFEVIADTGYTNIP